ncbi:MFS transporter [Micromonospora eburnea]|uniref:Predicted arabinose efflux permease, MFS family n=1 Tax=Micromonospora eburnea TaxID=227316 RepID=A0A1C6UQ82_9ACTN|nr:MFS transporter [Micromonospora eburnea]SCL55989.1 Predicted arabinose efflux permease, MFS family [Micromonospora eburnea]
MPGRLLPQPGPARTLALAQLGNSIGEGAFLVTSALYFTQVVGLSPGQVGLGLSVGWAVGLLAGVPAGHAADRRDARLVAVLLAVGTALAVAAFLLVRQPAAFVLVAALYGSGQTGLAAVRQALLARLVEPAQHTEVRARLQAVVNAGLGLGAALGGLALWAHTAGAYRSVLAVDAVAFLVAALLLWRLPARRPAAARPGAGGGRLAVLRDRPYALLTALNAVMMLYLPLLSLVLPLWVARRTAAPSWLAAALLVVNTAAVMLAQVRVARRVVNPAGAVRSLRRAGVTMAVACGLFALSAAATVPWAAAVILLLGAGAQVYAEMAHGAGAWQLSFDLAPADRHGLYQGFFGSGVPLTRMLGPVLLTWLIVDGGSVGWLVFAGLYAAAAVGIGSVVRGATRPAPAAAPGAPALRAG